MIAKRLFAKLAFLFLSLAGFSQIAGAADRLSSPLPYTALWRECADSRLPVEGSAKFWDR